MARGLSSTSRQPWERGERSRSRSRSQSLQPQSTRSWDNAAVNCYAVLRIRVRGTRHCIRTTMSARIVTVLVVDDRPDVRLSLVYMLEASVYVVAEAPDGRQAIATIARRQVDVVLADLSMPT